MSAQQSILLNTASNVAVPLLQAVLTLLLTPLMVRWLGDYDYGIWQFVVAIVGYAGILDLGLRPTVSRFIAKYYAVQNHRRMVEVYSSGIVILGISGLVVSALFIVYAMLAGGDLSNDGSVTSRYVALLFIIAVQLLISFPGYAAESALEGTHRFFFKNLVVIVNSLIGASVVIAFIATTDSLLLVASVNAIGGVVKYLIFILYVAKSTSISLSFSKEAASFPVIIELAKFGSKSLVQGIASRIQGNTDVVIIGSILSPASIMLYSIPAALIRQLTTLVHSATIAFMPLMSDLFSIGEKDKARNYFMKASRLIVAFVFFSGSVMIVLGYPFITIWLGRDLGADAQMVVLILTLAVFIPMINPLDSRVLTAANEHGLLAKLYPAGAVLNVALSLYLVWNYGVVGVAFGSIVPPLFVVPIVLRRTCAVLGIPVVRYFVTIVWPPLALSAMSVLMMKSLLNIWGGETLVKIAMIGVTGTVFFFGIYWVVWVGQDDRQLIRNAILRRSGG